MLTLQTWRQRGRNGGRTKEFQVSCCFQVYSIVLCMIPFYATAECFARLSYGLGGVRT